MLPVGAAALYELLRLLLKIRSQEQGVIPRLIASDDDLKRLAVFSDRKNPVLRGWRFEIFGRDAVALREGKLGNQFFDSFNTIADLIFTFLGNEKTYTLRIIVPDKFL